MVNRNRAHSYTKWKAEMKIKPNGFRYNILDDNYIIFVSNYNWRLFVFLAEFLDGPNAILRRGITIFSVVRRTDPAKEPEASAKTEFDTENLGTTTTTTGEEFMQSRSSVRTIKNSFDCLKISPIFFRNKKLKWC